MSDEPSGFLAGHFLLSQIDLMDRNFYRTVVLLLTHDADGAFGLVVNKPSGHSLGEVIEGLEGTSASTIPVFIGGPVQMDSLFALHKDPNREVAVPGISRIVEGVTFEPATRSLIEYLAGEWSSMPGDERPTVRLYAGYSGWGPGQLENELKRPSWVVMKASEKIIFDPDPAASWAQAFAGKGPLYKIILQTSFRPSMN